MIDWDRILRSAGDATVIVIIFAILYWGVPAAWEWLVMTFAYRGEVG